MAKKKFKVGMICERQKHSKEDWGGVGWGIGRGRIILFHREYIIYFIFKGNKNQPGVWINRELLVSNSNRPFREQEPETKQSELLKFKLTNEKTVLG